MTVARYGVKEEWAGLGADDRPADVPYGSTYFRTDDGELERYTADGWIMTGQGAVRSHDIQLDHADILALTSSAVELIPAPGPGLVLLPLEAAFFWHIEGGYSGADSTLLITLFAAQLADSAASNRFAAGAGSFAVNGAGDNGPEVVGDWSALVSYQGATAAVGLRANDALVLFNAAAAYADGHANNTLTVRSWYRVLPSTV